MEKDFISKDYNYAVVGASNNPEKYGYRILKDLSEAGYKVFPVNPKGGEILGIKAYEKLADIPETIDVVDVVVPPTVAIEILKQVQELGITKVWLQPGSESDAAIQYCVDHDIECIHHACIMIQRHEHEPE